MGLKMKTRGDIWLWNSKFANEFDFRTLNSQCKEKPSPYLKIRVKQSPTGRRSNHHEEFGFDWKANAKKLKNFYDCKKYTDWK